MQEFFESVSVDLRVSGRQIRSEGNVSGPGAGRKNAENFDVRRSGIVQGPPLFDALDSFVEKQRLLGLFQPRDCLFNPRRVDSVPVFVEMARGSSAGKARQA